jgi:hypothetical protein
MKTFRRGHMNLTKAVVREPSAVPSSCVRRLGEKTLIWYSPSLGAEGSVTMLTPTQDQEKNIQDRKLFSVPSWLIAYANSLPDDPAELVLLS